MSNFSLLLKEVVLHKVLPKIESNIFFKTQFTVQGFIYNIEKYTGFLFLNAQKQ